MRRAGLVILLALAGMAFAVPSRADDIADCRGRDPDVVIAGCSRFLQRPQTQPNDRAVALANRSRAYIQKGNLDEAFADSIRSIDANPKSATGYIARGRVYYRKLDYDRTVADAERALQIEPRAVGALQMRGNVHARKGDYQLALNDFNRAVDINPKDPFIVGDRGNVYASMADFHRAIADFSRAIELAPTLGTPYTNRGLASIYLGEYERALVDLTKGISIEPKNSDGYAARGRLLVLLNETERGLVDINRALELNPNSGQALIARGNAYTDKGQLEIALRDYNRAIEINPNDGSAYASRCRNYTTRDELEKALEDCNRAVQLNPKLSGAYAERGRYFANRREYEKALIDLDKALELLPRNFAALTWRGRAYIEMKLVDRGLADLERAIEMMPRYHFAYAYRGMGHVLKGQLDRGLADFSRAIQLDPRLAEAFGARAEVFMATEQWELAIADLRKVLSLPARSSRERESQLRAVEVLNALAKKMRPEPPAIPINAAPQPVKPLPLVSAQQGNGRRMALVIGNSAYVHGGMLRNPANDARKIGETLKGVGFNEVTVLTDLPLAGMDAALKDYAKRSAGADWSVIYFAGHGLEMGGMAYLVPTDARIERDSQIPSEAVSLERMLQATDAAKRLKLVILDACRNNPFVTRMITTTRSRALVGLPNLEIEGDVIVAYATKHGTTASDGDGENSPYALALAENMRAPDVDIRVMFGRVRDDVRKVTRNRQEPYTYGSIGGDLLYFVSAAK